MTHLYKAAAAAVASLALLAGASTASAQSLGFNQAGQAITASGQLIQNVAFPGVIQTVCNVDIYGTVAADGSSIVFDAYDGVQAPGDGGNLACSDSLEFPIVVTASTASQINLDQFIVGTRAGPCQEANYKLAYALNTATFSGQPFGVNDVCNASGSLTLTRDSNGAAVNIVTLP